MEPRDPWLGQSTMPAVALGVATVLVCWRLGVPVGRVPHMVGDSTASAFRRPEVLRGWGITSAQPSGDGAQGLEWQGFGTSIVSWP